MSGSFVRRTAVFAEWGSIAFGFVAFICGSMFVGALFERAIGWHYHFVSIGDFLGLKPQPYPERPFEKLLGWDRSFLWLFAAIASGMMVGGLSDFAWWLVKTPEQRKLEAELARERADKLSQLHQRSVAERKAARKAARKPLSGWVRLWIVVSVLLGAFAYIIAHDYYSHASAIIPYNGNNDQFWAAAYARSNLSDCIWSTATATYWMSSSYYVTCENADPWLFAALWAFLPGLVLGAVGLVCRWVYRGFRPKPSAQL